MPRRPPRRCRGRGCGAATQNPTGYCDGCSASGEADRNRRGKHKVTDPFYRSGRWQRYAKVYKRNNPLCRICQAATEICDHIVPIKDGGDPWDPANHQPLCMRCHNRKTGEESRARRAGVV